MIPADLPPEWRTLANSFREHAEEPLARAYERCADQLESALAESAEEPLTLSEAAEQSGYSPDHLGRMVREGKIRNAGRPNAPRIARGDLPVKPKTRIPAMAATATNGHTTNAQVVQSIIDEGIE